MIELLAGLIEKIKVFGLETVFSRYYSSYRAQVSDNKDPEFRGRIKVRIPVLFGDDPLPNWVLPKDSRGAGFNKGEFFPPKVDDWVFVEFEMGDLKHPIWSGGWHGETEENGSEIPPEFAYDSNGEPMVRGYVDPSGSRILFDETKEKTKLTIAASDGSGSETPKEHAIEMNLEKGKEILKVMSTGHFFVMDDAEGKEGVYCIHKIGTQWQIDSKGSYKLLTKSGHYVSLNDEDGAVMVGTKDGTVIALKDNVVISEASGKSMITISKDNVQVITAKDLVMQSNSTTIKSGSMILDGGNAKVSLGSAKIALGTATCEIVDTLVQIIDAFLNDPALVGTPSGPSSGLIGTAKVQLTMLKTKLSSIKGSL